MVFDLRKKIMMDMLGDVVGESKGKIDGRVLRAKIVNKVARMNLSDEEKKELLTKLSNLVKVLMNSTEKVARDESDEMADVLSEIAGMFALGLDADTIRYRVMQRVSAFDWPASWKVFFLGAVEQTISDLAPKYSKPI